MSKKKENPPLKEGTKVWYFPSDKFYKTSEMKIKAVISGPRTNDGRLRIQFDDFRTGKTIQKEVNATSLERRKEA